MANQFFVPFNFAPSNTDYGNSGRSYTCPSGKYARISATLYVSVWSSAHFTAGTSTLAVGGNDLRSHSIEKVIWVTAGEVVTVVHSAAATSGSSTSTGQLQYTGTSESKILVDGNIVGEVEITGYLKWYQGTAATHYYYVLGNSDANFRVEEYDIIS